MVITRSTVRANLWCQDLPPSKKKRGRAYRPPRELQRSPGDFSFALV